MRSLKMKLLSFALAVSLAPGCVPQQTENSESKSIRNVLQAGVVGLFYVGVFVVTDFLDYQDVTADQQALVAAHDFMSRKVFMEAEETSDGIVRLSLRIGEDSERQSATLNTNDRVLKVGEKTYAYSLNQHTKRVSWHDSDSSLFDPRFHTSCIGFGELTNCQVHTNVAGDPLLWIFERGFSVTFSNAEAAKEGESKRSVKNGIVMVNYQPGLSSEIGLAAFALALYTSIGARIALTLLQGIRLLSTDPNASKSTSGEPEPNTSDSK